MEMHTLAVYVSDIHFTDIYDVRNTWHKNNKKQKQNKTKPHKNPKTKNKGTSCMNYTLLIEIPSSFKAADKISYLVVR